MNGQWRVTVVFMQAPWTGELNLAAALESSLLDTGEVASPEDVLTFDRGSQVYDGGTMSYAGNGIPDLAEVLLVEELFKNPEYAFPFGVWGEHVRDEFVGQYEYIHPIIDGAPLYAADVPVALASGSIRDRLLNFHVFPPRSVDGREKFSSLSLILSSPYPASSA